MYFVLIADWLKKLKLGQDKWDTMLEVELDTIISLLLFSTFIVLWYVFAYCFRVFVYVP